MPARSGIEVVITALTRNQVYRQRYRGFESHPLRQTTSIPIRGWMLFFVVGGIRKPAPWRHAGGMSQPAWENPTHSAGWLRHPGMDVVFLLWVGFESRRLGDMPVACRNRRGRIPPTPPVGCVIRGRMSFFCCGWDSKAGALATCRRHVATGVGGMRSLCPGGAKPAYAACSREPRKPGIRCHFDGQKACIHASFRRFRNYSHSLPSSLF